MVLKNYFILAGLALTFQNCQTTLNSKNVGDTLTKVEWSTYGGMRGYVEKVIVTKGNVYQTSYTTMNDNETTKNTYEISAERWNNLVEAFNLADFKKVKDGPSQLPFDGVDQKIIVHTAVGSDSLINGFDDQANYSRISKFTNLLKQFRLEKK